MCGRLNVIDDPAVIGLCEILGIKLYPGGQLPEIKRLQDGRPILANFRRFIRATEFVNIIHEVNRQRVFEPATWWLLLEQTEVGFKPSKYTSFNTRYDKLNTPRSAGFIAFRHSRCIIPVKGFGETQGKGKNAVYTDFQATNGALALGGVCREWKHSITGKRALSCSVITLPCHEKLNRYHEKSMPLILNQNDASMDMWLDGTLTDVSAFEILLQPYLPQDLFAQQINKPATHQAIGETELIISDIAV
jgi:putative SOS response-associated peptidase YedK